MKKLKPIILLNCLIVALINFTFLTSMVHGMIIMPTQDATVHAQNPDANYGADMQLLAERHGSSPDFSWSKTYVQFESPTVTVTDIEKIEAFALARSFPRQANLWLITSKVDVAWNESTITFNNAPYNDVTGHALEANAAVRIGNLELPAVSTNQTVGFMFSDTGKADLINAMNNYAQFTLVISRPTDRSAVFASRESGNHPVQITVVQGQVSQGAIDEAATIGGANKANLRESSVLGKIDTTLSDAEFFEALDLSLEALTPVRLAIERMDYHDAIKELAAYYRSRPLKGKWWDASAAPVDKKTGRSAYEFFQRLAAREPPFDENRWNDDGSFNWKNATNREHRMYFFSVLANAYRYSQDEAVTRMFVNLYSSWIDQFPYGARAGNRNPEWATLISGMRLRSGWGDAFAAFSQSQSWDDSSMFLFLKSFYEQASLLRNHHSRTSNWLTFELAGLYSAGVLFPEFKDAAEWRDYALGLALDDIDHGWLPDGMSIELTLGYGRFFTNFLTIVDLAEETGQSDMRALALAGKCESLFSPYLKMMAPNWHTPALNNNRAVNVPEFLSIAAERFPERKDFLWASTRGKEGEKPDYNSVAFPYAGKMIMRSGWQPNGNFLCFTAGPLGYRHAHQDKLSVVLNAYGREIIYDPGATAHGSGTNEFYQQYAYDTFSHSTGLVDDRPQRRRWYRDPHPDNMPYEKAEDFEYHIDENWVWARGLYKDHYGRQGSVGNHSYPYMDGSNFFEDWTNPATHERQILFIAPDIFIVQDIFTPLDGEAHKYEVRWQIDSTETQLEDNIFQTSDFGMPNLAVVPLWTDDLEVVTVSAQDEPEIVGWKVIDADNPRPATALQYIQKGEGVKQFLTLLLPIKEGTLFPGITFDGHHGGNGILRLGDGRVMKIKIAAGKGQRLTATVSD